VRMIQALLPLALLGVWSGASPAADLVVIASGDPSIAIGTVIDGTKAIDVETDVSVVMVSSDGRTIKLTGPYNGAPDISVADADSRLVESLSRLITEEAGSPATLAVFRGGLEKTPIGRPDVWGIDIARAGRYCLRPDRPVMLWWRAARPGAVVALSKAADDSRGVRIRWPQSKRYTEWPAELTLTDGTDYLARFRAGDTGIRLTTLRMPELAGDAHRAAWMAEHGCARQALGALDAMAEGDL